MFGIGQWEILVIFLIVLLFFGAKRLPEMAQGLGKGIREFRRAVRDVQEEIEVKDSASSSNAIDAPSSSRPETQPATAAEPTQKDQEEHPEASQKPS